MSQGNLYVGSGGVFQTGASSTLFGYIPLNPTRALTINGTANQISSSAGSQDLSADRTWTLSLPNHVIFPGNFKPLMPRPRTRPQQRALRHWPLRLHHQVLCQRPYALQWRIKRAYLRRKSTLEAHRFRFRPLRPRSLITLWLSTPRRPKACMLATTVLVLARQTT
jgi:hypothetical protein